VKWQGWPHMEMTIIHHMKDDEMESGCLRESQWRWNENA
jgi:hypothetical protein